jgi:hypothetical protein
LSPREFKPDPASNVNQTWPLAQLVHAAAPAAANFPAEHNEHSLRLVDDAYLPLAQFEHTLAAAAEYVPCHRTTMRFNANQAQPATSNYACKQNSSKILKKGKRSVLGMRNEKEATHRTVAQTTHDDCPAEP